MAKVAREILKFNAFGASENQAEPLHKYLVPDSDTDADPQRSWGHATDLLTLAEHVLISES